jgi:hypothetical protein
MTPTRLAHLVIHHCPGVERRHSGVLAGRRRALSISKSENRRLPLILQNRASPGTFVLLRIDSLISHKTSILLARLSPPSVAQQQTCRALCAAAACGQAAGRRRLGRCCSTLLLASRRSGRVLTILPATHRCRSLAPARVQVSSRRSVAVFAGRPISKHPWCNPGEWDSRGQTEDAHHPGAAVASLRVQPLPASSRSTYSRIVAIGASWAGDGAP